ncbi:MAG: NADH-quinone oxidoreductase subunit J [Candidatus Electrothrix sp. LOE1_4_5]|jgi:NADH-quinone oxidoreductase subunit J|nr:NADH-quinone oxidoreductase subunit J [Candidatus Electrothrix sp. AX1]MCI5116581.1 NADH-quinone oxidoreductase subunit J [Candidatus Electrothrix gigas]MCI5178450.1 NADH-quinone oxidoreductase subunit J [Candidatus Electrothrix gigas]MCI5181026.1 NADH-quinone oxidoreductase subunit J [Candidatus Electrothrix gigas]MCI5193474.1 NADH-quinone oxidoreductase subunit J [Candidatus Electrothrix gigas]
MSDIFIYMLVATLVMLSCFAVGLPNILHSALALIGSFMITAALYISLQIELLALAQIMVYIGGIVVFMLLIILLTTGLGVDDKRRKISFGKWMSSGFIIGLFLTSLLYFFSENDTGLADIITPKALPITIDQIGIRLLSTENGFIVPFEVISLLLLAALVGAVVLARKDVHIKKEES